jgi:hypothetical protein
MIVVMILGPVILLVALIIALVVGEQKGGEAAWIAAEKVDVRRQLHEAQYSRKPALRRNAVGTLLLTMTQREQDWTHYRQTRTVPVRSLNLG